MLRHSLYVIHHTRNVRKYKMVLTLEYIVRGITFRLYNIRVIDKSLSKRLDFSNSAFQIKLSGNG